MKWGNLWAEAAPLGVTCQQESVYRVGEASALVLAVEVLLMLLRIAADLWMVRGWR